MSRNNDTTTPIGFESDLWRAADALRSNMDAAEYKHVVLGLIFLKYILRRYGYPPDKQEKSTQTVLEQAEVLCRDWAVA